MSTVNNELKGKLSESFTWGRIVKFHEIGEYLIVEAKDTLFDGCSPAIPRQYEVESSFHGYSNGDDHCRSYSSLDEALVGLVALKHDGLNTRADRYFMKMIGE